MRWPVVSGIKNKLSLKQPSINAGKRQDKLRYMLVHAGVCCDHALWSVLLSVDCTDKRTHWASNMWLSGSEEASCVCSRMSNAIFFHLIYQAAVSTGLIVSCTCVCMWYSMSLTASGDLSVVWPFYLNLKHTNTLNKHWKKSKNWRQQHVKSSKC